MIARNPIIRSLATVFLFWYIALFLVAGLRGVPIYEIVRYLAISTGVLLAGGILGAFALIGLRTLYGTVTETTIREGGRFRDVQVALGRMPPLPTPARAPLPKGFLANLPWWPVIERAHPAHANAIRAVLEVMHTRPSLPASPIPGGHGGRTLLQHSLGVATEMIAQAKTWQYEGQRDKRGRIRVRLNGPPHRFEAQDAGLLVLTGLAHDIGKIVCFEDGGKDADGRPIVREVNGNHDTEGARILRSLPEVMALPYPDRIALLMAVGYYHHPFAMPNGAWITDRMRSLMELLIKADLETGRKEGHTLTRTIEEPEDDDEDVVDANGYPREQPLEDEDEDPEIARIFASLESKQTTSAKVTSAPVTPEPVRAASARDEQLPMELATFLRMLATDGAINGRVRNRRIAWKHRDRIYVMDEAMRRNATTMGKWPGTAHEALQDVNGNGAPFTLRLLEQLDQRGWLVRRFDGHTYPPSRALFYAINADSNDPARPVAVFIVKIDAYPNARQIPCAKPMLVQRSLWDPKTKTKPKGMQEEDGGDTAPVAADGASDIRNADLPVNVVAPVARAAAPEAAAERPGAVVRESRATVAATPSPITNVDLPFDVAPSVSPMPSGTEEPEEDSMAPPVSSTPDVPSAIDADEPEMEDALPTALLMLVTGDAWPWPVETRPRDDGYVRVIVPAVGEAGNAIRAVISAYQERGIPTKRVQLVRRAADKAYVFVWDAKAPAVEHSEAA